MSTLGTNTSENYWYRLIRWIPFCVVIHLKIALKNFISSTWVTLFHWLSSGNLMIAVSMSGEKVFWKWLLIWASILQLVLCSSLKSSMDQKINILSFYNNLQIIQVMHPSLEVSYYNGEHWIVGATRCFNFLSFLQGRHLLGSGFFLRPQKVKRVPGSQHRLRKNGVQLPTTTRLRWPGCLRTSTDGPCIWLLCIKHQWWLDNYHALTFCRPKICFSNVSGSLLRAHNRHICLWKTVLNYQVACDFLQWNQMLVHVHCSARFNNLTCRMNFLQIWVLFRSALVKLWEL